MLLKSALLVLSTTALMTMTISRGAVVAARTVLVEEGTVVVALETAPVITSQPANQLIVLGQTATLGVTASGTEPLAYQWQGSTDLVFGWVDLTNATPYSGVKTPTLKVTPTSASQTFQYYRCVVTNSAGSASSAGVYVWAYSAPVIGVGALLPPGQVDVVVNAGQDATFVVVQSFGAILGWPGLATFQWQVSNDRGASWNDISEGGRYSIDGALNNHSASVYLKIADVTAAFDGLQYRVVATNAAGSTTSNVSTLTILPPMRFLTDADRDGKSEIAVFRPSIGGWFIRNSSQSYSTATASFYQWGFPGDVPIAADFDGDGKIEVSVFRPPTGQWFIRYSSQNYNISSPGVYQWGLPGDVPIPGDFDGDGRSDLAVFRPSIGGWFIRKSTAGYSTATASFYQWGLPGMCRSRAISMATEDRARRVPAADRPMVHPLLVAKHDTGTPGVYQWGCRATSLAGDFDGTAGTISRSSGRRPGNGSSALRAKLQRRHSGCVSMGATGRCPLVVDFDADFKTELTVFRPATGEWFIRYSTQNYDVGSSGLYQWGLPGDVPIKP